jgi:hypothetical protein
MECVAHNWPSQTPATHVVPRPVHGNTWPAGGDAKHGDVVREGWRLEEDAWVCWVTLVTSLEPGRGLGAEGDKSAAVMALATANPTPTPTPSATCPIIAAYASSHSPTGVMAVPKQTFTGARSRAEGVCGHFRPE